MSRQKKKRKKRRRKNMRKKFSVFFSQKSFGLKQREKNGETLLKLPKKNAQNKLCNKIWPK